MKFLSSILLPVLFLLLVSCQTNKLSLDQMFSQDKFEPVKIGDQLYEIKVNYYDTVSAYDSPYQRYMSDNSNKPDGKLVVYDEAGRIRRTLFYKNHLREGTDTWFYPDGEVMQEKKFVNGHYTSYKTFYPKHHLVDTELDDTLGIKKHYDEQANLIFEKNYVTGAYKEWYPNGKIRVTGVECPRECFILQGPWRYYTQDGLLDEIVFFSETTDVNRWDSVYHYRKDQIVSVERK
jgi:antitoxin component YwqK of YwqJK toxin-antitoxin module